MSSTTSKPAKITISRQLRAEIRRSFCVWGFAKVHTMSGMSKKQQESMLYDLFHGSSKYPSHIDKILKGEDPYDGIYQPSIVTQNDSRLAAALVVKDDFTTKESTNTVKAKVHITKMVLERAAFTNPALISGRALLDLGKSSMRTIRKLISILIPHLDDNMKPKRSGESMADVWEKVLDEAYVLLNSKTSVVEDLTPASTQEEDGSENQATRPASWRPDGWMALHLFGPTAPSSKRLNLLTIGEPDVNQDGGKKKRGRAANRAEQAKDAARERDSNCGGNRGITVGNQIGIASLILSRKQLERDQEEQRMMTSHLHANRLIDQLNQAICVAGLFPDDSPSKLKALGRVDRLQDELDKLNEQISGEMMSPDKKEAESGADLEGVDEVIDLLSKKQKKAKTPPKSDTNESTTVAKPSLATQKPPSVVYCTPNKSSVLAKVPEERSSENNQAAIRKLVKSLLAANGLVPYTSIRYHLDVAFPGLDIDASLDDMVEEGAIYSFDHLPTGQPMEMHFGLVDNIEHYDI